MKNKKKSSKKSLIKFIIIDIFLILCVAILFCEFYQSKKAEQTLARLQTEQEERRKQEELEIQAQQEEKARQEHERLEQLKASLPTKFDMRNKIKITAENQGQKPLCSDYARIKAIEIALNYQGNYNYNFKKVYKYLQTVSDEEKSKYNNIGDMLEDLIGLDNNNKFKWENLNDIELKNELVNGKPLLIMIDYKLSSKIGADPSGNYARTYNGNNRI